MPIVLPLATVVTAAQAYEYNLHRETCQTLGIPQSTLRHRGLMGTLSAASATGVRTYTGPNPSTTAPAISTTQVWATWQPQLVRTPRDPETGRQGEPRLIGQMPAIDDNQNVIALSDDDELLTGNGQRFKILNPSIQPDLGFWTYEMLQRR